MSVHIIGTGLSDGATLTVGAQELLDKAQLIVGASRLVEPYKDREGVAIVEQINSEAIAQLCSESAGQDVCVLMSGDTGFYSGATKLYGLLRDRGIDAVVVPGISSVQALAARLGQPWQDWHLVSAHGRDCDPVAQVRDNRFTFFLTGGDWPVRRITDALVAAGFDDLPVTVGERLGTPQERIVEGRADDLFDQQFDSLSVLLVENYSPRNEMRFGYSDEYFLRGDAPMTKSEVRAIIGSKLRLSNSSVVWDIGAGTGSVTVEAAMAAPTGQVYAVECEEEACELIRMNALAFCATNVHVVHGMAPEACADLPAPDVVFIGGSKGNLQAIVDCAFEKSSYVRVVATAVTLETIAEAQRVFADDRFLGSGEVVSVNIARSKALGDYHLLMAQNPVMVFSGDMVRLPDFDDLLPEDLDA